MRSALSKGQVVLLDKVPTGRSCKRLFSLYPHIPTTTVLQTLLRGRYLPAWKQRVTWYAQARGQFPNNPRCWSYLQAQGSTNVDMQKPKGGETIPLYSLG